MEVDTLEVVQKILQSARTDCIFKSTLVTKDIDLAIDVGNLLAVDRNPLDLQRFRYVTRAIIQRFSSWRLVSVFCGMRHLD